VKVCQLETGLDDTQRIGKEGAYKPGYGRCYEVVVSGHGLFFKVSKTREVDVAAEGSFEASCHESLIESFESIFFHDVFAGCNCVVEEIILGMKVLESSRRDHEGHLYVFEGLQHDGGHCSAYQPVNTILINHK